MCVVDTHYEGVLRVLVFLGLKIFREETDKARFLYLTRTLD